MRPEPAVHVRLRLCAEDVLQPVYAVLRTQDPRAPGRDPQLPPDEVQLSLGHAADNQNHIAATLSASAAAASIASSQICKNHPARSPVKPPNCFIATAL